MIFAVAGEMEMSELGEVVVVALNSAFSHQSTIIA